MRFIATTNAIDWRALRARLRDARIERDVSAHRIEFLDLGDVPLHELGTQVEPLLGFREFEPVRRHPGITGLVERFIESVLAAHDFDLIES